nr:CusA/CzcA family heavy metal efflux RND transporter [uncultured Prevotella sp.]
MIKKIIYYSITHKFIICLLVLAIISGGIWSLMTINVDSTPDITNNQVQIITVSQNLSTADIEQFVTYPVEMAMANLPGVKDVRSVSRFGLSVVTVVFKDNMGTYLPRQLVQEKLNEVKDEIPEGFGDPEMGPITTGLGEIYQYTLHADTNMYSPRELRTIQDWTIKRQLTMIPGVVEVNSFGGSIKQYEVALSPERLNAMHVSIGEVFNALKRNNVNTGGAYIEKDHKANFIRGEGVVKSVDDIKNIVVRTEKGIPVTIGNVADDVKYGSQIRYGAFTQDGHEAVGGMILMLKGANSGKVVKSVKDRISEVQKTLPAGIKIQSFLDRSQLIHRTTSTIARNLIEGALIVIFVLVLLLGSLRGGLVTASLIPLSLLFAFIMMRIFGVWANLMSLGAIDFGIIVDGAVIIVEGTVHELEKRYSGKIHGHLAVSQKAMDQVSFDAANTMMHSAFFGQLIILIVFTPILFLAGVSGKMFQPMAFTFSFALLGAIILCLTYVPMITSVVMRPLGNHLRWLSKLEERLQRWSWHLMNGIYTCYHPVLKFALKHKTPVLSTALLLFILTSIIFARMGGEFVPSLDEGDIAMQTFLRPGSSLSETVEREKEVERLLLSSFPEIKTVCARIGVADIPTDPMGFDYTDSFIILEKDRSKWTSAQSKEELISKIKKKLSTLPGLNFSFSQPVELRFNELLTGIREDVAVKLYGEDLDSLNVIGERMEKMISRIPGAKDVALERTAGLPQITVQYNRKKLAQYGLSVDQLNQYVSAAFAGADAGEVFEGEKRFDMVIRLSDRYRKSIDDLKNLYVDLPNGSQIPLGEVAEISYQPGPMQISRDGASRRIYVGLNVRGRDVESVVSDIKAALDSQLRLPAGYRITYGGSFQNLQEAKARLGIVLPVALLLIFIMLYFALKSVSQALMIYIAVPMATIGGILALTLRGMPFSISAGVGFIVLFGVAVLNGLVLVNRLNTLKEEGISSIARRIYIGTQERLRPILLTALAAMLGFLPMAISNSAGAEVQRPLATVVIGGLFTATLLTLVVIPVLYALLNLKHKK